MNVKTEKPMEKEKIRYHLIQAILSTIVFVIWTMTALIYSKEGLNRAIFALSIVATIAALATACIYWTEFIFDNRGKTKEKTE